MHKLAASDNCFDNCKFVNSQLLSKFNSSYSDSELELSTSKGDILDFFFKLSKKSLTSTLGGTISEEIQQRCMVCCMN